MPSIFQPKTIAGAILKKRKPSGEIDLGDTSAEDDQSDSGDEALNAAASDLLNSIHLKDLTGVASALRSAFQVLDSESHEEGPHFDEQDEQE